MSEERAKILKLLKEGRITVEEAGLLLDALEEGTRNEESFAGAEGSRVGGERSDRSREERRWEDTERDRERDRDSRDWWGAHDWGRGKERRHGGPWQDFDFSRFQNGFEGAFRGMEQTIRDTFKNFSNLNFDAQLGRMFGREREEVERAIVIPAEGLTGLSLKNAWGEVEATASDIEEIRIEARVAGWGTDSAAASALASSVEITHRIDNGRLIIEHHVETRTIPPRYKIDFTIALPRRLEVELKGLSGNLSLEGTKGKARLMTLSGDITVKRVEGEIAADSKSGDVEVVGGTGDLNLSTVSGEIVIENHHGKAIGGRTISGDVRAELSLEPQAEVSLSTIRGDVRLKVPASSRIELTAETVKGEIDCTLPLAFEEESRGKIQGVLNEKEGRVALSTKSGSISIRASS